MRATPTPGLRPGSLFDASYRATYPTSAEPGGANNPLELLAKRLEGMSEQPGRNAGGAGVTTGCYWRPADGDSANLESARWQGDDNEQQQNAAIGTALNEATRVSSAPRSPGLTPS